MADLFVQWDVPELTVALEGPGGPVMAELFRIGNRVRNRSVFYLNDRLVRVRTGRLKGSMVAAMGTLDGGPAVLIGSDVVYAPYVHDKRPFLTTALDDVAGSL